MLELYRFRTLVQALAWDTEGLARAETEHRDIHSISSENKFLFFNLFHSFSFHSVILRVVKYSIFLELSDLQELIMTISLLLC